MSGILDLMQPIQTDIARLVPRFLYADRNGYALCKAIERAMQIMAEAAERGLEVLLDVDKMPEWRLDELAQDYNCLYDYTADIEAKRVWIKNAYRMDRILGTPEGVSQYLRGYFDRVDVLEAWDYGGEAYHFRVDLYGRWTADKNNWIAKSIDKAKNVRSVLDGVNIAQPPFSAYVPAYAGIGLYIGETHSFAPIAMPDFSEETFLADGFGELMEDGFGAVFDF